MVLKRREFLASSLAASALACRRRRRGLPFEAAFLGPAVDLGHRLRWGELKEPSSFEPVDVVVAGGGIAGLGAAWRLAGEGFGNFVLCEMEDDVGGTSRGGLNGVSAFPWGAHYVPAPSRDNPPLLRLLREAGVLEGFDVKGEPIFGEQFLVRAPEERIHAYGQWWEGLYLKAGASPGDEAEYHAFFAEMDRWALWRDGAGRKAFTIPRWRGSDAPEVQALDRQSFAQWLDRRGWRSERLRWFLEYACRDDYGATLETTSAWAGIFYFAARKTGPGEESRPLLSWPEGNGFLVNQLRRAFASKVRPRTIVTSIRQATEGILLVHAWDEGAQRPVGWQARKVVFALPQYLAAHTIPSLWEARPEGLESFTQSPWMVVNVTLRERPKEPPLGFPLSWDNVIRDSPSLGYVVATHQALKDHGPTVWTWYQPFTGPDLKAERERMYALGVQDCARMVLADLQRVHPGIEPLIARMDIIRWGHAMVRPRPGFCWSVALQRAREPHQGIHFAHTDLSGIALLEEALDHGVRAAEEVLAALGRGGASWR
ncbi:MAG: FAD-dependent oxidoreductase [Acidobacteria bacterium]|nr:FAD-dependent oxidoreductase [Acidobacteriota bacterium]